MINKYIVYGQEWDLDAVIIAEVWNQDTAEGEVEAAQQSNGEHWMFWYEEEEVDAKEATA